MTVSAVVLTYNDKKTIAACLDSIDWCDEIVVVDSNSDDGTSEIVANNADLVENVPPAAAGEPFDQFRQVGFEAASNEWLVLLDGDERIPVPLAERLHDLVNTDCADVFWAPRKNIFKNRWLNGGYWWPAYTPRLVKRSEIKITPAVHDFYEFNEDTRHLRLPAAEKYAVVHQKADSYSDALKTARRHAKIRSNQEEFHPSKIGAFFYTFWKFYIDSQSYKDGVPGFFLSLIRSIYRMKSVVQSIENYD